MASRDLKGLTVEIGGDTSNLTSALKNVDKELNSVQSNLRTVNSALKLDSGNTEALAEKQRLLADAVEQTASRLDLLREAQRQADEQIANGVEVDQQAYNSLRAEIIRAEASLNDYARQLDDARTAADRVADASDDAGDAAEDAGDQAEDAGDGWTVVKDVIADLASQVIQNAIQAFADLALGAEVALDRLQAKTGLSSKAMENFGKAAKDTFKQGWGESLEDVTDAMGTVYTMMGDMDTDHLQMYTENAMALSDVFGYDVAESIRAVNALEKQFGITGEEAFNLITQGAQNGLDQNGDLLDTINEYSLQFEQAGYSADEMFNMLLSGVAEGTWSVDKLGDAVKEYNIRLSDGTVADALMENRKTLGLTRSEVKELSTAYGKGGEAGKEAMKTTLDAVLAVEDETERYKLGVALFGTMWEDLGEDAVKALFDTEGGIKATNDAMGQVKTDAYDNLATSLTTLGRTLKDELLAPIVDTVAPVLKGLIDWMIENMEIVKPIIIGVATAFGVLAGALAISGIISGVSKAMTILNTTLLANPITLIVAAIAGLVAAFIYLWNNCEQFREFWINLWEIVKDAAATAWEAIQGFFSAAWEAIQAAWGATVTWFSELWANTKNVFWDCVEWFSTLFANAWAGIQLAWEAVTTWFVTLWEDIKNAFWDCVEWFTTLFTNAWLGVQTAWTATVEWFTTLWSDIKNAFWDCVEWFGTLFTNAWLGVQAAWEAVTTWFTTLWEDVKNVFWDCVEWFGTLFANAWAGIQTAWSYCVSFFTTIWNSIKIGVELVRLQLANAFQTAWAVIKAVWSVVSAFFQTVWDTIAGIFSVVQSVLSGDFQGAWDAIKGIVAGWRAYFQTVWNSIKSVFGAVVSFFKNTFTNAWSAIKGIFSGWADYFSGLWDEITSGFGGLPEKITSIGSDIVTGLWNGINDMVGWIGDKISSFGDSVLSGLKRFFGIASPSKLMRDEIGRYLAEGVGVGIDENAEAALEPMEALKNDLTAFDGMEVSKSINLSGNSTQTGVQRLMEQMNGLYELVNDYLPGIAANSKKNIYLDKRRLVGELASDMDAALGEIADRKAVGAV